MARQVDIKCMAWRVKWISNVVRKLLSSGYQTWCENMTRGYETRCRASTGYQTWCVEWISNVVRNHDSSGYQMGPTNLAQNHVLSGYQTWCENVTQVGINRGEKTRPKWLSNMERKQDPSGYQTWSGYRMWREKMT